MTWIEKLSTPKSIRKVNGYLTLFWVAWFIPAIGVKSFRNSIMLVAAYSVWANMISHYTAWLTARTEVRAENIENLEADEVQVNGPATIVAKTKD